jgi:hypothetical protein
MTWSCIAVKKPIVIIIIIVIIIVIIGLFVTAHILPLPYTPAKLYKTFHEYGKEKHYF